MNMRPLRVVIAGGGLSGLYAAFLLEQQGIHDYVLLEARDGVGGRIASASIPANPCPAPATMAKDVDRFDLGPTWFWPTFQPELDRLISDLNLQRFEQFDAGDMLAERAPNEPPMRVRGYASSPASMRLVGGMGELVDALHLRLDATRIVTGQAVRLMRATDSHVEVESIDASGRTATWLAEHVLLAIPPRLAEAGIDFTPPLPQPLAQQWRATATWMAPHAKYIAIYDVPFWREQGLSGEARSSHGPLGEIHDASMPGGSAALFGFFGIPARIRKSVADEVLRAHCRAQLARLFGPQAAQPKAEFLKDWALDPYTATSADLESAGQHGEAPAAGAGAGPWRSRLTGIASEWSRQFPGYVAGAIDAARLGLQSLPARTDIPVNSLIQMGNSQ